MTVLHEQLTRYHASDWSAAVEALAPEMHVIDRDATRIWFSFFPLDLLLALESAPDAASLARRLGLMGTWRLADQIGRSHRFLYAHRYWPQVRAAIMGFEPAPPPDLPDQVRAVAMSASRTARVDPEMLLGISAVLLMTLRQVGPEAFAAEPPTIHLSEKVRAASPHQTLRARARDDWQGVLGFARGLRKQWSVTYDETEPDARFTLIDGQEIATAARTDQRDHHLRDRRCTPNEGPIPVECRAASCGTCWIGVLGGAHKLSPVNERDERRRMLVFGYIDSVEERPLIRLACQAKAHGAVSIVIPPWNGVLSSGLKKA
jgi:ferredoxin